MATRFAVASTPWNTPSTWDNGAVPVAGDTVYPNGFTVTLDQDINVASLDNNTPPVVLPNMNIPAMTGNTQPSGIADSSGNATTYAAYLVFDQNAQSSYRSNTNNACWITYEYPSARLIKRYYLRSIVVSGYGQPASWNFEGWNGSSWDLLEGKTGMGTSTQTGYTSPILTHTTLYSKYRLNVTVGSSVGFPVSISQFELGESTGTIYGTGTGGSFTVPSSLVGTRNIEFSGDGIRIAGSTTCINIAATTGATVNFNRISGGEIFKPIWSVSNGTNGRGVSINGNCAVVFNGNIQGTTANAYNDGASGNIYINAAATVTINGTVIAPTISPTYPSYLIQSAASTSNNAILNINGDIIAGTQNTTYALFLNGINTVNITSNNITASQGYLISASTTVYLTIIGNIGYTNASSITPIILATASTVNLTGTLAAPPNAVGISTSGTGAITITGAMTGGNGGTNGACIVSTGTGAINIPTGTITNGTNASAISAVSSSLVTVGNSPIINSNNFMAIYAPRIRFYTGAQVEWTFQTSTGGTKVLRNADGSSGLPSYTNVKIGQPFGPNRDIIGACVIPPANAVGVGIPVSAITPVDDPVPVIVGTLQLTGEDLLNAISTSSNVVATRLKNVATVETTGDQLAAFNRI